MHADGSLLADMHAGDRDGKQDEDAASGTAVLMSAFCTAGGAVGVAYANTAFRNLGLLELADISDLEGVVVQVKFSYTLLHVHGFNDAIK